MEVILGHSCEDFETEISMYATWDITNEHFKMFLNVFSLEKIILDK